MEVLKDVKSFVIATLFLALGFTTWYYNSQIDGLQHELQLSQKDEAMCEVQKGGLLYSIDTLNDITESQKIDYDTKLKEFENYKRHPKVITIFRDRNLTTENCDEIKDALDAVSTVRYSDI